MENMEDMQEQTNTVTVLYEDGSLIAVEKKPGWISELLPKGKDCLPARLMRERGLPVLYPVHRLDKETGGVIVYAKTKESAAMLSSAIAEHRFSKTYLTVVMGEEGRTIEPSGELCDFLYHDRVRNKSYVVKPGRKSAKRAVLRYRRLGTVSLPEGEASLLSVTLLTGRTHQIRVQFASRGLPIYGDRTYGSRGKLPGNGFLLWACALSLVSPETGEPLSLSSFPPPVFPWTSFGDLRDLLGGAS